MSKGTSVVRMSRATAGGPAPRADVVFVHGLMGDPKTTWTANGKDACWPKWIAADFPDIGVWSVGYPTTVSKWVGRSMPLVDLATSIMDILLTKNIGVDRPLILVGHSMGGLVIKKMVLDSANDSRERWKTFAANTRAIMFLATPHTGSDLPGLGRFLEGIATNLLAAGAGAVVGAPGGIISAVANLFGRKDTSLEELRANLPMLRDLNVNFRQYVERRRKTNPIQISVYFETQATRGLTVVDQASADPGLPDADLVPLFANHLEICKFAKRDTAQPYLRLKELLPAIIAQPPNVAQPPVTAPTVPPPAKAEPIAPPPVVEAPETPEEPEEPEEPESTGPAPTSMAVAELGLDDLSAEIIVVACVVSDEPSALVRRIEDWKTFALADPLVPDAVKERARKADIAALFREPALRPRLLDRLATTPFSGYLYYGERKALAAVPEAEIRRRLLVQPLADRIRKKSEYIAAAQGNRDDLATSLSIATDVVRSEQQRTVASVPVSPRTDRSSRLLVEFAQLVAAATARHLAAPQDDDATVLFDHLRTRLRFAKNVATNEIYTRDKNPLP